MSGIAAEASREGISERRFREIAADCCNLLSRLMLAKSRRNPAEPAKFTESAELTGSTEHTDLAEPAELTESAD